MYIQELESALDFMLSIGYSNTNGASMLAKYFSARANGMSASDAGTIIFTEFDSAMNKDLALEEKIKRFHKKLCRIDGHNPEDVCEAIEKIYNP